MENTEMNNTKAAEFTGPQRAREWTTITKKLCNKYNYYVLGHYPSSHPLSKMLSCLYLKTQYFGDWILSPSSGKTYSVGSNRQS
jgi:hypothetical protein